MRTKLDFVNIVDLECCCWKDEPAGDIIEIGIVKFYPKSLEIKDEKSIIVLPETDKISEFCTELTTLTKEYVKKNGIYFREACKILETDYQSKDHAWISYGDFDRIHFQRMSSKYINHFVFGRTHINIKNLLALLEGWEKEIGMERAYNKIFNKPIIGTHHRGIDDAKNISEIVKYIYKKYKQEKESENERKSCV